MAAFSTAGIADTPASGTAQLIGGAWIVAGSGESVSRLQRKLPHYGKYGYLVFAGPRAENRIKGSWRANETDLVKSFDASKRKLPPRPPLVDFKP